MRSTSCTFSPGTRPQLPNLPFPPTNHRDPFDRLIVAQAKVEGMTVVSADAKLDAYGITRLW